MAKQTIMLADKAGRRRKPKGALDKNHNPVKPRTEKENKETLDILFATISRVSETDEQKADRIRNEINNKKNGSKR